MCETLPKLNFPYRIIRSQRKSLGLYVKDQGIEVRSPYWLTEQDILSFLHSKTEWCLARLDEQATRLLQQPSFDHGGHCLFFGEYRHIQHHIGQPQVLEKDQQLHVFHRQAKPEKPAQHARYLKKWMRKEGEQYLTERCYELEALCQPPKPISAVQFRKTKSKWGHCTSHGEIQLNWLLIMAPPDVMDYVIIHEICHLTHMNHSKPYWQLVEQLCPDYRQQKSWLADHGHRISF